MLSYKKLLFACIFLSFVYVLPARADVLQLEFASGAQTANVENPIAIKVGLEDTSGATTSATETIYLNMSSTEMDGQFSSNNTTWKSVATLPDGFSTSSIYISSGNTSRTFYYEGFTPGTYTVTVSAKSKSGFIFSPISETLTITGSQAATSTDSSDSDSDATTTATSTADDATTTNIVTVIHYISAHADPEDMSNYLPDQLFQVSAGRDRLVSVGAPLSFVAYYQIAPALNGCNPTFTWSFGDGTASAGSSLSHAYTYDGTYELVLNASCGAVTAVSRAEVHVITPQIVLHATSSDRVAIANIGADEINLGGWKLGSATSSFLFPADTILAPHTRIIVEASSVFDLINPLGDVVATTSSCDSGASTTAQTKATSTIVSVTAPLHSYSFSNNSSAQKPLVRANPVVPNQSNVSGVAAVAQASSSISFLHRLIFAPINGIKTLLGAFYHFQ